MPRINRENDSFTQADGTVEVRTINWHEPTQQVSFKTDSTTGTLDVKVKYHPEGDFEVLYGDDGTTPLSISLAAPKAFQLINKWVYSLQFTPTGVDASYTPLIASGRMYEDV